MECECDGEPDGGGVAGGRQVIGECRVGDAPRVRHPVAVAPRRARVEVQEVRQRQQAGQRVGDRHAHQQRVGRVAHRHLT